MRIGRQQWAQVGAAEGKKAAYESLPAVLADTAAIVEQAERAASQLAAPISAQQRAQYAEGWAEGYAALCFAAVRRDRAGSR